MNCADCKKTTTIGCRAVREAGLSQHHGSPIDVSPETPRTSQHKHIEGFRGATIGPPLWRHRTADAIFYLVMEKRVHLGKRGYIYGKVECTKMILQS